MLWMKLKRWGLLICGLNDSTLVCVAFTTRTNVSWLLRNRWNTLLEYMALNERGGELFKKDFRKLLSLE